MRRAARVARHVLYWLAALLIAVLAWGAGIEPRIIEETQEIARVPGLPDEWRGARLAVIADLQVGMWLANTDTVRRAVSRIVQQRPAAVLIAGDFLYHPTPADEERRRSDDGDDATPQIDEAVRLIGPLADARIPVFAVLGNHDYAMRWPESSGRPEVAARLAGALTARGVTVLRNRAVPLGAIDHTRPSAARLYIAGVDAWGDRHVATQETLSQIPDGAPRVLLMHYPEAFRTLPARSAPFAVAAHTHGGQARLPFLPDWSWMSLVKEAPVAADGWASDYGGAPGNRLYVNRGIGFSVVPLRINCPPELTWFVLDRG